MCLAYIQHWSLRKCIASAHSSLALGVRGIVARRWASVVVAGALRLIDVVVITYKNGLVAMLETLYI